MFKLLVLLSIVYSSLIHASFSLPTVNWQKLTEEQKIFVWAEYREALKELEVSAPDEVASFQHSFIDEAYAAGFECFVAGWPSTKVNGKCATPVKMNPHYSQHLGCLEGQLLCHPALFGETLCIDFKTLKQKNSAFSQCEKKFAQEGRSFSQVLSEADSDEMNDLIATVHHKCGINSANYTCQKLRKKLDFLIPNETPSSYKSAQQSLGLLSPDKILDSAKTLQREMEGDIATYEKVCADGIDEEERLHCKNLALRVKKAQNLIPKLMARANELIKPADCVNCSSHKSSEVISPSALPAVPAENLQCTEAEKQKISNRCFEDVKCVIVSTAMSAPLAVMEAFGKKPGVCMNSQNDCLMNVVSALVDSLVSLVTGIWDLLGTAINWTGEKLANFWEYVTKVEDKTSDSQQMLNKMSAKDVEEVKQNPIQWITSLAGNIWKGLGQWMKEDIYCEKWAGIPRASECVQPSRGFDCMSCRTMITGTCSAAGVIIAEVVPALLTGGGANLVAKAGNGAKAFTKFIKVSKSYKKIVTAVDKLSDVRAIKLLAKGTQSTMKVVKVATKPISYTTKVSFEAVSSGYKAMVKTKSFQALSKSMDVAAKYTGVSAFNKLNARMYTKGYDFVDTVFGTTAHSKTMVPKLLTRMDDVTDTFAGAEDELKLINEDLKLADAKRIRYQELEEEGRAFKKIQNLTEEDKVRLSAYAKEVKEVEGDITIISNRFTENMQALFAKNGIPTSIGHNAGTSGKMLILDLETPSSNRAVQMYKRVKDRFGLDKITLSLEENTLGSSKGFFMPGRKRIDMGPEQGKQLLQEFFNLTSKHESRHAMFFSKRAKGKESVFHMTFKASPKGDLLNMENYYEAYMSAEELYTFSTDLQTLAQAMKGENITDLVIKDQLLSSITKKNKNLTTVANTSKRMSQEMMDSIDEIMKSVDRSSNLGLKPNRDGSWEVIFQDKVGRTSEIQFVTDAEKAMAKNANDIYAEMSAKAEEAVKQKLADQGVNIRGLESDMKFERVSEEHKAMMNKASAEYSATAEAQNYAKQLDDAVVPIIEKSRTKFHDLHQLAEIQLKESAALTSYLNTYQSTRTGGQAAQLKAVKDQMFKTAKNVKEDYAGYVLKKP